MNKTAYRHGDLCLVEIDKLPEGLKKSESKILNVRLFYRHYE